MTVLIEQARIPTIMSAGKVARLQSQGPGACPLEQSGHLHCTYFKLRIVVSGFVVGSAEALSIDQRCHNRSSAEAHAGIQNIRAVICKALVLINVKP